jgi:colanic acid/amylovoran biosynthesis glycosyltransferase
MRIAFIVDSFPKLTETFILSPITGLIDLGYDVRIFSAWPRNDEKSMHPDITKYNMLKRTSWPAPTPSSRLVRPLIAAWLFVSGLFTRPRRTVLLFWLLITNLRRFSLRRLLFLSAFPDEEFDIVHCHYGHNGILGLDLRRIGAISARTRVVTSFHGYDEHILSVRSQNSEYRMLWRDADMFTACTTFTKDKIVSLGADPARIEVIPLGLRMEKFTPPQRTLQSGQPVNLITVARLVEKKGIGYTIDAINMLKGRFDLRYRIVGDGPLRDELWEKVREHGLEDTVTFCGSLAQDKIIDLYRQADIFLLTSVTASDGEMEGQGLVIQEAQACGVPVISTFHNGIPEGLVNGETGILVPEKDTAAIVSALEFFLQNPQKRLDFGKAARRFVEERYDIRNLVARVEALYKKLLTGPAA